MRHYDMKPLNISISDDQFILNETISFTDIEQFEQKTFFSGFRLMVNVAEFCSAVVLKL